MLLCEVLAYSSLMECELTWVFLFSFQAFSFSRTLRPKRTGTVEKESPEQQHSAELLSRLSMLEEQVRLMSDELNKVN